MPKRLNRSSGILSAGLLLLASACSGKSEPTGSAGAAGGGGSDAGAGKGNSDSAGSAGRAGNPSGGETTGGTSNLDQPDCATDYDALDASCEVAQDCALVERQVDCCGTIRILGLPRSQRAAFSALEQYCAARFPLCGCAAQATLLDDGTVLDQASSAAVADCIEGRCRSRESAVSAACGTTHCSQAQYCEEFVGGPAGSEPSYSCKPLGDCKACSCLNVIGCQCTESGGAIKVFCAAP
jgi:hypothetical protein